MRIKIRCICVLFLAASGLLLILRAYAQNPGSKPVLSAAVQEHLKEVAQTLPSDSLMRYWLERGAHGDGVRRPWMDAMRREGVKRVVVRTKFVWHKKPTDIKVTKLVYFSTYDGDCGQISDPERLSKILASGLEAQLRDEAIKDTFEAHWLRIGEPRGKKRGFCIIELLEDEWLPRWLDSLILAPKTEDPLQEAVAVEDVASVTALLRADVTPYQRDGALWAIIGIQRPCTVKALLRAGADPDQVDRYGSTLLMEAIRHGDFEDAKVLVDAGADVNAKNRWGATALSIAEGKPELPGKPDIVRLLKSAGARN